MQERESRKENFAHRNRLNIVARSLAAISITAAGVGAAEKSGAFDLLEGPVDSANHLVLDTPHKAYEQLIEILPGAENAEAQTPQASYRALIVYEGGCSPGYQRDAYGLRDALVNGGWTSNRIIVAPIADNLDGLKTQMAQAFDQPGENNNTDLKLFYFSGHGGNPVDQEPLDETHPPVNNPDEDIDAKPAQDQNFFFLRDDELGTTWAGFNGKKVLIWDSCYSGGMVDGSKDPKPNGSYIMMACQHNEQAAEVKWNIYGITWLRWGVFTSYLREGLGGPADTSNPKNGITFEEAFNYADTHAGYEDQDPMALSVGAGPNNEIMVNPVSEIQIGVPDPQTRLLKCSGDSCSPDGQCGCPLDESAVGGIAEFPDVQSLQNMNSEKSKDNTLPIAAGAAAAVTAVTAAGAVLYIRKNRST